MRNCLILGSGRSGTSMLAAMLSGAGYYMGTHLIPADDSNPKGYFEDDEINAINEALLAPLTPTFSRPSYGWRWLAQVPVGTPIICPPAVAKRMEAQTRRVPYAFKDPRLCYTLPAWRAFLSDTVFLCIFREPARTAHSIVKECRGADYLQGLPMDFAAALDGWTLMYRHILDVHRREGDWLFFHYDQLFEDAALARVERALGVPVDRTFPDAQLKRSPVDGSVSEASQTTYGELCDLAGCAVVERVVSARE